MITNQTEFLKEKQIGQIYRLIGKIVSHNQGENFNNIDLFLLENFCVNIKIDQIKNFQFFNKEKIYVVKVMVMEKKNQKILICQEIDFLEKTENLANIYRYYSFFFPCSPISFQETDFIIKSYLDKIQNQILSKITDNLYFRNQSDFLISPAAFKMHHNYYGGLGYHVVNMLKLTNIYLQTYPYLNADLLYSGIILHDIGKIQEFDFTQKNYTKEGLLLGHLILGVNQIHQEAIKLGYENKEEVLLLKHLMISHHGFLEYGAAKRPQIGEALLLWYLDDIDSKLTALGEKIANTPKGHFTESLDVLGKRCFYNYLDI
ncbi:MAG: HD domain-containing protein [Vigna little leaf phytoplasma]|nr:HD domain-containing protein [Vigna little leaf phytoplasma]